MVLSTKLNARTVLSVLKSGPVRFFAFFGCNRTETGPKKSAELRNRNRNRMQPVACSCVVSCNQFQPVAYQTGPQPVATCNSRYVFISYYLLTTSLLLFFVLGL